MLNGKWVGSYNWLDNEDECRRLSLSFCDDNKLTLQTFLCALKIKEKEISDNYPSQLPPTDPQIPTPSSEKEKTNQSNGDSKPSVGIIVLMIAGGIAVFGLVVCLMFISKKQKLK